MKINLLVLFLILHSCAHKKTKKVKENISSALDVLVPEKESNYKRLDSDAFLDKTVEYGLGQVEAYNFSIVDINQDNYSDVVVIPSIFSQPRFYYHNIEKQKFEEGKSPFQKPIKASYILFYDINNDKILDALVGVLNQKTEMTKEPLRLFLGKKINGQLIFNNSQTVYKPSPNSTLGLIDYNLDGRLDFFIGNWLSRYKKSALPVHDALIENTKDGFKDRTSLLIGENKQNLDKSMYINATPTYAVQICDMDQNGYPDILTTSTNQYENKLWMNRFKTRGENRFFENIGQIAGFSSDSNGNLNKRGGGRSFALACADYNNDKIMDVFVGELSHIYDSEDIDKSSILTGRTFKYPPRFYRTEYFLDSDDPDSHQADRRGLWVDYNNDGLQDLLVDNSGYPPYTKMILFKQEPDHSFSNVSKDLGIDIVNPTATVVADFNRDGKADILTAQSNIRDVNLKNKVYLFINNVDMSGKTRLRFFLRGKNANYYGLNAMVVFYVKKTDGTIETRRQNVSYSYGALSPQNEEGLFFGLNQGETLQKIRVTWPYAKDLNVHKSQMEKVYKIKEALPEFMNITLCEAGNYLIGRRDCI